MLLQTISSNAYNSKIINPLTALSTTTFATSANATGIGSDSTAAPRVKFTDIVIVITSCTYTNIVTYNATCRNISIITTRNCNFSTSFAALTTASSMLLLLLLLLLLLYLLMFHLLFLYC